MDNKERTSPIKRGLAAAALILILLDIICMFANIICGGEKGITLLCLFGLMVIPAVIYIFIFFYNAAMGKSRNGDEDN